MVLDGQININTIVQVLGFLLFGFAAWTQLKATIEVLRANYEAMTIQMTDMKKELEKLAKIAETSAAQAVRLDSFDSRMIEKNSRLNAIEIRLNQFFDTMATYPEEPRRSVRRPKVRDESK